MRRNKHAAIEVSINTIIILIFAVIILSLGIVFVRRMFTQAGDQFIDVSDSVKKMMIDKIQSSNSKLTFDYFEVTVKKGEQKELYFGIKNDFTTDQTFVIKGNGDISQVGEWVSNTLVPPAMNSTIKCYDSLKADAGCSQCKQITFDTSVYRFIKSGEVTVFKLIAKASGTTQSDTYSCAMVIDSPATPGTEYARADFSVVVP